MRLLLSLTFFLVSAPAFAQVQSESDKAWAEVQKTSAEALASQDCRVACRALESLQRATKRLCDIGPEHCEEARAKLKDATDRVRTTCPECEVQTVKQPNDVRPEPPPASGGSSHDNAVATEAAPSKSGGCASCNTSEADPSVIGLLALALLALRKKSKR